MASKIRFTKNTLDKIEQLLHEAGYIIRYEKGNFQSGFCVLESRNLVIINRFFEAEGRIIAFLDIIPQLAINTEVISESSMALYQNILVESEKEEMV
ncbi:MAG: hypothetical protein ABI844_08595 [Saprospiraceae bacterium]